MRFRVTVRTSNPNITPSLSNVQFRFTPVITFNNQGDLNCRPEIWIEKHGNGDISLINTSKHNEEFKFTSLIDQEIVYVDNQQEHIETSLPVTYRYSNFNDNYLDLKPGLNIFTFSGDASIQFRYQFKTLQ
ncbi:hypothetical protein D1872_297430 [compost metagenome]